MLLRIGKFSSKTGTSIRTLRFYDEIDLFKPIEIDLFTGYRYYSEEQIEDLELINTLKSDGFTLDEIKEGKKDKAMNMLNTLSLEIFKEDRNNHDPFWENMALVLILFKEDNENQVNIGSVQAMINGADEKIKDTTIIKNYLSKLDAVDPIYTLLSSVVYSSTDTKGSILSVLEQKLNVYVCREQLLNLLSINEIKLDNLEEKSAIFVIDDGKNVISNVFIDEFTQSLEGKKFNIILDNLDTLPVILNNQEIIANTSYLGNRLFVSIHNLDEMKDKYGQYVFDNFQNVIETKESNDFIDKALNNNAEYPILEMRKFDLFNLKKFGLI